MDWILVFDSVFCLWFHASACPLSDASSPGTGPCVCLRIYAPAKPLVYSACIRLPLKPARCSSQEDSLLSVFQPELMKNWISRQSDFSLLNASTRSVRITSSSGFWA
ncbi:hypothetical protein AMECASPLE_007453 [Ameca splendens]|uniref:Secreted protein n=1 Tax=Ameca splendens TaxID=208324 RepID=A0ABV0XNM8_9TELE